MNSKTVLFIGAGVLFLIGLCLLAYGVLSVIGSTSTSVSGDSNMLGFGLGFGLVGALFLAGGAGMVIAAMRGQKTEVIQEVKIDLPGQTKIEEIKCRSCGGTLAAKDIKIVNGAPMVNCPYCGTIYQLTEEPKW